MFPQETKILVIDDSYNIREMIVKNLQKMGFINISTAVDVPSAWEAIKKAENDKQPFDLILSDLNMPGLSGLEFLKQFRQYDNYVDTPFILVTTESEKTAVLEAAASGVSNYVVKPFDTPTLSRKLIEAWKKHNKPAA